MRGLNALDFVVIAAYLVGVTLLGVWVGRRQRDAKDYFVADREIPWWAVMFSIVASETSALTFISIPGLAYTTNLGFLEIAVGYLFGRIVIAYTLLPRYYEGQLVTAYALLEQRFGLATRRFTSIVFMVTRGMADSVRVFATAVPIALIIGPLLPAKAVMPVAVLVSARSPFSIRFAAGCAPSCGRRSCRPRSTSWAACRRWSWWVVSWPADGRRSSRRPRRPGSSR